MNTTNILESVEEFLYTPYGLGTLAAAAIILTSLVWCIGCCIFCCCAKKCRKVRGVDEASGEIEYLSVVRSSNTLDSTLKPYNEHGTGTSGYQSHVGSYSLDSIRGGTAEMTTSMDSILDK